MRPGSGKNMVTAVAVTDNGKPVPGRHRRRAAARGSAAGSPPTGPALHRDLGGGDFAPLVTGWFPEAV